MCNTEDIEFACKHHIQHTRSHCRGQIKEGKDTNKPACRKKPSLYTNLATKCGSCTRAEAEQTLRRTLTKTKNNHAQPSEKEKEDLESLLEAGLAKIATQIPTINWRAPAPETYTRKPSEKRVLTVRKHSILRNEFTPEEACGPEAWEDNVVQPVYETVATGWDFQWTAETKSLADELEEDAEWKREEMEGDEDEGFGDEDEGADEDGDEADADAREEENDVSSPDETQEASEADVREGSVKVRYRFRKTTPGCKAQARHWEMVGVWV